MGNKQFLSKSEFNKRPPPTNQTFSKHSNQLKLLGLLFLSIILVMTAYIWFISFGSWIHWPAITNYDGYYNELALAFQHGSLALEIKPSPALLALHDPYDPTSRHNNGIAYPIDFSLYEGNYYLYFGPVPALFLLVVKFLNSSTIDDLYLVFVFVFGMFLFQSLLILKLWKRFFQNISIWMLSLCILFCGLISPIPWILTEARVYEAASTGGQFFFLAGLYFAVTALDRESISIGQFLLAGIAWALAIGSRLTQIAPIGFMVFMIAIWMFRIYSPAKTFSKAVSPLIALCFPLILGLTILGWYNWARFNSVFESGLYYQLAEPFLQKYSHVLFSVQYLLPNLYNYLAMRPEISTSFPFLQSIEGDGAIKFSLTHLPAIYHEGALTGILFSTPFALFAAIPVLLFPLGKKGTKDRVGSDYGAWLFNWLIISLLGSFLFGFAPIVIFFVETRYIADFMPSLVLLSIMGFFQGYSLLTHKPGIAKIYSAIGIILIVISIIVSIVLALSAHAEQFQQFNPILWNHLISLFQR